MPTPEPRSTGVSPVPPRRWTPSPRVLLGLLLAALLVAGACAFLLPRSGHEGELVWGGDQEGGAPYVYPDDNDPDRLTGFEVELMDRLAGRLGLRSRFQQCEWTDLQNLLRIGDIDCITNGFELTAERQATMLAT